jgi:t-SNARE complex subunit (syntaxin)
MSAQPNDSHYEKLSESISELTKVMYDIRDRVTRMEEKQNRMEQIEDKADKADATANKALLLAQQNEKNADAHKVANRWAWGVMLAAIIAIGGTLAKVLVS